LKKVEQKCGLLSTFPTAPSKQSPIGPKFAQSSHPGTDVMIKKIFLPKNLAKILAFFALTTASFCKICDRNIGF
jgi:hypothetical protein